LDSFLSNDVDVRVVVIAEQRTSRQSSGDTALINPPQSFSELPLLNRFISRDISHIAFDRDIPVIAVSGDEVEGLRKVVQVHKPDVVCVACFPRRLPEDILKMAHLGFLNLHPSLLPDHKGPAPLFWIFRSVNQDEGGVTVHYMNEGFDTGDILLQEKVVIPFGISGPEAEQLCGEVGGKLLAMAVSGLGSNSSSCRTQLNSGSYETWPQRADFRLDLTWDVERAYRFMKGTAHWNQAYYIEVGKSEYQFTGASGYEVRNWLDDPIREADGALFIQFSNGVLEASR
jgi:methionyl-tRNA formyltransferase